MIRQLPSPIAVHEAAKAAMACVVDDVNDPRLAGSEGCWCRSVKEMMEPRPGETFVPSWSRFFIFVGGEKQLVLLPS